MANTRITQGVIKPNEDYDVRHINATGIITATNVNVSGVLTYEDVTNVDSIGIITARKGIVSSGVVTATAFHGDGSNLTGVDSTALKDPDGNVKVQAQASGAVHTGISTFDTINVGSGVTIESNGQATFTGIVTFGSNSTTINGGTDTINVGTALTLGHTQGLQFHTQNLHSEGFEVNNINASGIITAAQFSGDGSNLANLPAGLGTALSSTQSSPLNKIYYTNTVLPVESTITVDTPASASAAYTQYADISVGSGADLIISDGDDLIPDVLGLRPDGTFGGGALGRMRVDKLVGKDANSAVNVEKGLVVTGVVTATSFSGDGSSLTGIAADKIFEGNTEVETIDTGSNGHIKFTTEGTEKVRITSGGHISQGSDAEPSSSNGGVAKKFGIKSNANNVIIGETESSGNGSGLHIESRQTGRSGDARIAQIGLKNDASGNGQISFFTAPNGSGVIERMSITSTGRIEAKSDSIQFYNSGSNPSNPQNGDTYYNSTDNALKTYVNGAWLIAAGEGRIVSSGSTAVYTVGGQKYLSHTITSSGIVTVTGNNVIVDYLLVAGGGGGGCLGGGGGAGGVLTGTAKKLEVGDYNVTIGGGGLNGGDNVRGATGGNTTAFGLTALGGGGGGSHDGGNVSISGSNGGSGGGGSDNNNSYGPGSGTSGQGNNGGNGSPTYSNNYRGGGGGGGAGGVGLAYNVLDNGNRGNGGIGILNAYETGSNNYYAGGGGKAAYNGASDNNAGDGGHGGGGGGSQSGGGNGVAGDAGLASANGRQGSAGSKGSNVAGGNGGVNTGGGAGCNAWQGSGGASGGSGIIVIRYKIT